LPTYINEYLFDPNKDIVNLENYKKYSDPKFAAAINQFGLRTIKMTSLKKLLTLNLEEIQNIIKQCKVIEKNLIKLNIILKLLVINV